MVTPNNISWLPTGSYTVTTHEHNRQMLLRAYQNAAKLSFDPSTQNGSVLACNSTIIDSANFFPTGILGTWERPLKYELIEHAERNAIYAAARAGIRTANSILYCPWYACTNCARAIIQAGVRIVVGHQPCFEYTQEGIWKDSIVRAFNMLNEAGVQCLIYQGRITADNSISVRFNGNTWEP